MIRPRENSPLSGVVLLLTFGLFVAVIAYAVVTMLHPPIDEVLKRIDGQHMPLAGAGAAIGWAS
ncbi:MAG: hypothetical protein AAF674_16800 [Pseudomonadota bacterium]